VLFGASGPQAAALDQLSRDVGKGVGLANTYASFASPTFVADFARRVAAQGAVPMVTWLPCKDGALGPEQPEFSLRRVASGDYDGYIRRWAASVAAWRGTVFLRFAPEMNGTWNPWSAGVNGNSARDYIGAWRHVHDLFEQAGAANVVWVWSPNVVTSASPSLQSLYPGDRYVDWVGIDGYNWGKSRPGARWRSFEQVFGSTLSAVRRVTRKPIMLSEVGSSELGGDKAAWIQRFFAALRRNPDVLAFVWFNFHKETDWRVESSPASVRAFAAAVASPFVRGAETSSVSPG
jgi:beta-mannanase